jgi:hypothetical protein
MKCKDLTAKACGIQKSSVSLNLRDAKKSSAQGDPVFVTQKENQHAKKSDKPR